jgi:hypothetical protein
MGAMTVLILELFYHIRLSILIKETPTSLNTFIIRVESYKGDVGGFKSSIKDSNADASFVGSLTVPLVGSLGSKYLLSPWVREQPLLGS